MQARFVLIADPARHSLAGMIEAGEQRLVHEFIPHPPDETLAGAVLHPPPGCYEEPGDLTLARPGRHGVRGELDAMITDDQARLAPSQGSSCRSRLARAKQRLHSPTVRALHEC